MLCLDDLEQRPTHTRRRGEREPTNPSATGTPARHPARPDAGFGSAKGRQVMANDAVAIGSGAWRYRFQRDWAKLPRCGCLAMRALAGPPRTERQGSGWPPMAMCIRCAVARIRVMVFDAEGRFDHVVGRGRFTDFVHGMTIDRAGRIWITDTGQHTVTQHEADGTLLRTLGTPGAPCRRCMASRSTCLRAWCLRRTCDISCPTGTANRKVHCFLKWEADDTRGWAGVTGRAKLTLGALHHPR